MTRPFLRPGTRRSGDRVARDRGVALVEAAFVFPLIVLITFVAIEFGLIFASQSTTQGGTQGGARLASASLPVANDIPAALDAVRDEVDRELGALVGQAEPLELWIYRAAVDGSPIGSPDFSVCGVDCRRYVWSAGAFVLSGGGGWASPDACLFDGDSVDVVGVYVKVRHDTVTGFLFDTIDLEEHTSTRLEPLPSEDC